MIPLKDFVKQTLADVIEAVAESQEDLAELGVVNPTRIGWTGAGAELVMYGGARDEGRNIVRTVEFDVAVTSAETDTTKTGVGVFVAGLGAGARADEEVSITSVSRIRFEVPLLFPPGGDAAAP